MVLSGWGENRQSDMNNEQRFLLTDVNCIGKDGTVRRNCNLLVEEGVITRIGKAGEERVPAGERPLVTVAGNGGYVTPGLVNMHTHSPMNIFRGIAEDVDADTWFNRDIWPYESVMEADDIRAGTRLAAAEMLANGVTSVADHYFSAGIICETALEAGLRLDIAPTLFGMAGGFRRQLAETEMLHADWHGRDGRIAVRLGPHSPYTCSDKELEMVSEVAGKLEAGIHIHVSETAEQVARCIEAYGKTPFSLLQAVGLLQFPLIVGHGIYITDSERSLLAGKDISLAVSPKTYLKLGMGVGNILDRPEELPLVIGTDGAASSNTLNPLEQARILALLGKDHAGDGGAWRVEELWSMLMRGHDALPFNTGDIAVGMDADMYYGTWMISAVPRCTTRLQPCSIAPRLP